jgi:hypothetical protein
MTPYLGAKNKDIYKSDDIIRRALPPQLFRQGERTQPDWLFRFLKNPKAIRPVTILRMPKFNMSDDDAQAIVNYFAGADRQGNPGIGLVYPYQAVPQRDETYWRDQAKAYVNAWPEAKLVERASELTAIAKQKLADAEAALKAAQEVEKKAEEAKKKEATDARLKAEAAKAAAEIEVKTVESEVSGKKVADLKKRWEQTDIYSQDAFRLLANRQRSICLACHKVGTMEPKEYQGPDLGEAHERLRPEWTLRWIASPQRLIYYKTPMPQNFPRGAAPDYRELFDTASPNLSLEQVRAIRDVLMNFPRVSEMPVNRKYREDQGGVK